MSPDGVATCQETIDYCTMNIGGCGGSCDSARQFAGVCCPPEPCDICQGRPILDLVLPTTYTCEESNNYCTNNICPDYGETCPEVQAGLGGACCEGGAPEAGAADEQSADEQPTDEQPTDEQTTDEQTTDEQTTDGESTDAQASTVTTTASTT